MSPRLPGFPSMLMLAALCAPVGVHAQVRRCTGPGGGDVFTDRRCEDIGSIERRPPAAGAAGTTAHAGYRGGCARNLQELVYEITNAVDARDGNRLASVYHWTGMSSAQGYAVLSRLQAITERPLLGITPLMPSSPDGVDGDYYPQTSVRRAPVGLRLEQTSGNGSTPSLTVFGLQRNFGCWWIRG